MSDVRKKNKEDITKLTEKNMMLHDQILNSTKKEETLQQTINELETHGDYAHKQVMSLQSQVEELQKHHSDILCELVDPTVIKDKINDIDLVKSWIAIYKEALRKCKENVNIVFKRVEQLRCEKLTKQEKVMMIEDELDKCAIELENFREEQTVIETKILERNNELEFKTVPDILDELNEKKCGENEIRELQEKKKLLNVIQRDIKITEDHFRELETMLKTAKNEFMEMTVSCAIEEDKLDLSEKQLSNLETAVQTLNEHVENLDTYQKEKVTIEDVQSLKKQLSEAHEIAQEKQEVTIKFMKHFLHFVNLINNKLDAVECTLEGFITFEDIGQLDEIRSLKTESSKLVEAINKLQKTFKNLRSSKRNVENIQQHKEESDEIQKFGEIPVVNMNFNHFNPDEIIILKEKLRYVLAEKIQIEQQFSKLQQQYNYIKSYPYFDLYFILPIVILIFFCIFNFGDKLSVIFGTSH